MDDLGSWEHTTVALAADLEDDHHILVAHCSLLYSIMHCNASER
jgi:hypothetical protein